MPRLNESGKYVPDDEEAAAQRIKSGLRHNLHQGEKKPPTN